MAPTSIDAHFAVRGGPEFTDHRGETFLVREVKWNAFTHVGPSQSGVICTMVAFGEAANGARLNASVYEDAPLPAWAPAMPDWFAAVVEEMRDEVREQSERDEQSDASIARARALLTGGRS